MQGLRSLIERINATESKREYETGRFMEEQKIKKALGPAEWERLKGFLASHCEAVGKSSSVVLDYAEQGINAVVVINARDGRKIKLSYDGDVPCVHYRTPIDSGYMAFRVSPDGTMVQFMVKGLPESPDTISVILISQITG